MGPLCFKRNNSYRSIGKIACTSSGERALSYAPYPSPLWKQFNLRVTLVAPVQTFKRLHRKT